MLSVIFPTRNRADLLSNALQTITQQTLNTNLFEVIVIDNGSTDNTSDICNNYKNTIQNLRYFYEETPGLHIGRHKGLKEAAGEILVYADDDIEALPSWLETIYDCFQNPDVALVGGNNLPNYEHTPPKWLSTLWRRGKILGGHSVSSLSIIELPSGRYEINPSYIWGCNFSIRKSLLEQAGGFHPDGMPKELLKLRGDGETYISQYISEHRYKCIFDSNASVYHAVTSERMSLEYFQQRAFNQGISNSYTSLRNTNTEKSSEQKAKKHANLILKTLKKLKAVIKHILYFNKDLIGVERAIKKGYKEGYEFHQQAYIDDPEVREWVHKNNYL